MMNALKPVTLVLVLALCGGCQSWRPVQPTEVMRPLSARSRVILTDGRLIEIASGNLTPDSLIGISRRLRIAMPLDSIAQLQERRLSWGRTIGLAVGIYVGVGLVVMAIGLGSIEP